MDEQNYALLADATFRAVLDAFDAIDADDADVETTGDTVRITFRNGKKLVLNTQRAVKQIWLAGGASAWHFSWDGARWVDDKGAGVELHAKLAELTKDAIGAVLPVPAR